ncbi:MAG: hypothetical protein JNJ46_07410 [Myxococcales bacterium]|nr:hypothetical protein [Myxococcales bacterium]
MTLLRWPSRSVRGNSQPANAVANDTVGITTRVIDSANQSEMIERIRHSADGMLVSYITSRTGAAGGGKFHLDYRIVSTNPKNSIVLFAASKEVRYTSSSADEVDYNREDLKKLAEEIFNVFPNPDRTHKAQVVSIDGDRITIDMGKDHHVLPGMRGYVIAIENKILTSKGCCAEHISYLAKFQVTEVEHKYSTAVIIEAPEEQHDIRVGDAAVFK